MKRRLELLEADGVGRRMAFDAMLCKVEERLDSIEHELNHSGTHVAGRLVALKNHLDRLQLEVDAVAANLAGVDERLRAVEPPPAAPTGTPAVLHEEGMQAKLGDMVHALDYLIGCRRGGPESFREAVLAVAIVWGLIRHEPAPAAGTPVPPVAPMSYADDLRERLKDKRYAAGYLSAAADEPDYLFELAVRYVAEAWGMAPSAPKEAP